MKNVRNRVLYSASMLSFVVLASGCATPIASRLEENAPGTDAAMASTAAEVARTELSASEERADSRKDLARETPRKLAFPISIDAALDPLEEKIVNVSLRDAKVDVFFWVLAKELGINIALDPKVLELSQRASLSLNNVSAREALEATAGLFDLSIKRKNSTLTVSLMESRIFPVTMLSAKTSLGATSGGDLLGGGDKDSQYTLRGSLRMTGEVGQKVDAFDSVLKSVEAIIADEKTGQSNSEKPVASIDRNSQSIYVRARPSRLKEVAEFLAASAESRDRQVQIDLQLVDVTLDQGYSMGIDWGVLAKNVAGTIGTNAYTTSEATASFPGTSGIPATTITIPSTTIGSTSGGIGLAIAKGKFSAVLNALQSFGAVKLISNPTVRAKNGEVSYVSIGTNYRYISKVTATKTTTTTGTETSYDAQTDSLFSGIVFGISPSIKSNGRIELFVHPVQSTVRADSLSTVSVGGGSVVTLPIMDMKSVVTTLGMNSGDTVILGGLADQSISTTGAGVPGLAALPGIGAAFDKRSNSQTNRELIIVLRARVL